MSAESLSVSVRGARLACRVGAIVLLPLLMMSCGQDQPPQPETTGSTPSACATNLYANYNAKNMEQCVNVCLRCERGVMTTCSTSCTLKGAH